MLKPLLPTRLLMNLSQRTPLLRTRFSLARLNGPRTITTRTRPSLLSRKPNPLSRRLNSNYQPPTPQPPLSTTQRLKELSRKYGWAAVYVYLGLSALDFPFCFLAVRMLGPERVGKAEEYVVGKFWGLVGAVMPSMKPAPAVAEVETVEVEKGVGHHGGDASIWTQLLIAYGVHKSLIFFRVPLAAAVTPKVVKTLRKRGWNVGLPKA